MKYINITPHSILSVILVVCILFNTSVPAFAQVATPKKKRNYPLNTNFERQVVQTLPTDAISSGQSGRNARLQAEAIKFSNGSLTSAQLTRLSNISFMFRSPINAKQTKSDFDVFKESYVKQVNESFTHEKTSLQATKKALIEKIDRNITDLRKEVYEPLVQDEVTKILDQGNEVDKKALSALSKKITKDILSLSIDPEQSLTDQITRLNKKYKNNPQALQIINQVAQQIQTDPAQTCLLREKSIKVWKQQALESVDKWYSQNINALQKWKTNANMQAKKVFDKDYGPRMLQAREEEVKNAVKDLWAYKDLAPKARYTLLQLAPIIAQLRTLQGQSFFTQQQTSWIISQYIQILKKSANTSHTDSDSCNFELTAVSGLGMMSNSREAANTIENFMTAKRQTACAVPSLLTGTVALLSMKQYQVLEGFIYAATRDERNIKNFDILSIENLVNALANINGQYLGEVSKYTQYPLQANATEQTALGNAWEDVAQLLADDRSPKALELLRKYGVEKCFVSTYTTTSLQTKSKMQCVGIIPFLVGALSSGKSGADQYKPSSVETTPGYVYTNYGTKYISPKQAQENAKKLGNQIQAFHKYAANMGMSNTAAVARHLFLQSMGDLNAESELLVDTKLFKTYKTATRNKAPKAGFAISSYTRNSPAYNAKRARQDRTQFFRKLGHWADIGILIWCVVDITKWTTSGVKIARAMMKASSMARKGATVAQRAIMLRNLNIAPKLRSFVNLPNKIKNGMAPSVLAELPHFTSQTVELPKFAGFVESAGALTADALRFSAETGTLSVDVASMAKAADGTVTPEKITSLSTLAQDASLQANTQFANRSSWQRFFTWDKNASYRSYLAKQFTDLGQQRGFSLADLNPTRYLLKEGGITVPENIASFQAPSLLLKSPHGTPQLDVNALNRLMTGVLGTEPTAQHLSYTQLLVEKAISDTNLQFLNRNWLTRQWNFLLHNHKTKYRDLLLDNLAAQFDKEARIFSDPTEFKLYQTLAQSVTIDKNLQVPAFTEQFRLFGGANTHDGKFHAMGSTLLRTSDSSVAPQTLPLVFQMQRKRWFRFGGIKGVDDKTAAYQRVIITEKDGKLTFGFGNNLEEPITPRQFKLTLAEEDIPALLRATQNYTGAPIELKLTSTNGKWLWNPSFYTKRATAFSQARAEGKLFPLGTLLRGKDNIYVHKIPVQLRLADGTLQTLPVTFKADSYLGLRNASAILEEGGQLTWYQDGKLLTQMPKFSVGLPKNQIKPLLELTRTGLLKSPLRLSGLSGKNKIEPLMWATGLSLSSASTGLIAPLENVYGENITEGEKTLISLAFPYLPSLAAPLFSPLVMKIGALRTLQIALGVSSAGLAFTTLTGFSGKLDNNNLPPIWPLYVSGTAIGISSALSRSGLNLLIDAMGGGGTLLKSMAYKNIGSFALLLPPFIANFIDKDIDFSLAFPVLSTLSAASLMWVSTARLNPTFGKKAGFMPFEKLTLSKPQMWLPTLGKNFLTAWKETKNETLSTTRLLLTKEVLPLVIAATAFTGFEAGAFSKAGNQMIRPHLKNNELPDWVPETNRNNYVSMLTNLSVIAFPLIARLTAKPVLKFMETGTAGDEYRRMLQASFALNATGVGLLYANGFGGYGSLGMLGIGLMGFGTANMTQSFQKLSNISVKGSSYARTLGRGLTSVQKQELESNLVTKTMTGFPVQQLGIAIVPTIISSYTDRQIAEGTIQKSDASHSSLWIPVISLALCFGFSASRIGLFPTRLPTGTVSLTKGIFGSYPGAIQQLQAPQLFLTQPTFGVPTGFSSIPTNPIVDMSKIIPSPKLIKKIETNLQQETSKE